jgi:hypothetical protein
MTPLSAYWFHRQTQLAGRSPLGLGSPGGVGSPTRTGGAVPRLSAASAAPPPHVASLEAATARWAAGRMSNFEYLMTLNTYSGRTHNDWTQYPIFPVSCPTLYFPVFSCPALSCTVVLEYVCMLAHYTTLTLYIVNTAISFPLSGYCKTIPPRPWISTTPPYTAT